MKIADIELGEKPLLLAPMEDVTDPSFRYMCKRFGADVVYTEFISSDGLIRDAAKSLKKLEITEAERPGGIQIYGHLIEPMAEAARMAEAAGPDIIDIIFATREPAEYNLQKLQNLIAYGGSPRASISLAKAARAYAFIRRRGYVIPEDVRAVCHDVLRHRIGLTYEAEAENITSEEIITDILNNVIVP